ANHQVTGCPLGDTKIRKFLWRSARRVFTSLVSWCHPEGTRWLRSQLFGELVQEPATAVLSLPDRVGTLEEGALLGVDQARALAGRRYLHSREGDRDARVAGQHRIGQHDAPVEHDVEVDCVVAHRRAALLAEARDLLPADAKVHGELVDLPVLA